MQFKDIPISSPRFHARRAFTLIEATVALALAAIAGCALLMGVTASQQSMEESLKRTMALGMAEQLLDEILGQKYCEDRANPYETQLGCTAWESQGAGRERYGDIDDYNGLRIKPPKDLWGVELGKDDGQGGLRDPAFMATDGVFASWRQEIDVYYVAEASMATRLPTGQVSDYRAVEVRIMEDMGTVGARELAKVRRIVTYLPSLE